MSTGLVGTGLVGTGLVGTGLAEVVDLPVFWVAATVVGYQVGRRVQRVARGHFLAQPVLVAVVLVGAAMRLLGVDYADYLADTTLLTFWLGPATVALAVPLHRQAHRLRATALPLLVGVPLGVVVSVLVSAGLVLALGGGELLARTMAPKATTTPVSIALSEQIGGLPPLTAALTITAGILGATLGPGLLTLVRVRDRAARGIAIGSICHGIGTSRSLVDHPVEGAFAGLAMGLTALATSLLLPLLVPLLF